MAGIYIHIPFCRKACHYCNFHFSTSLQNKSDLVDAICWEIAQRKKALKASLDTIYLGGGTPSLLSFEELDRVMKSVRENFVINTHAEVTIEANPEDISAERIKAFEDVGINRVSIGIQSFDDKNLVFMNRAHSGVESLRALEMLKQSSIKNITADLMFGLIENTHENLYKDLRQMAAFDLPHLSIYNLTIEEQTVFANWKLKSKIKELPDGVQKEQFYMISQFLRDQGYVHYEISNYAKEGAQAIHNTNYWNRVNYIGVGPSAHSLINKRRSWNVSNNAMYLKMFNERRITRESETLTEDDHYNEIIMLGLRTKKGISKSNGLHQLPKRHQQFFYNAATQFLDEGILLESDQWLSLHHDFWYISDDISSELFITKND